MRYVAFIHKDKESAYGVSFPDLPGCTSAGATADEACLNAVEALAGHVSAMKADDDVIPEPRLLDVILEDNDLAEWREGATIVFVPLLLNRGSTLRVNISIDAGLLEALDAAAKDRNMTRSAFIASAVRNEIMAANTPSIAA
jgi:predicted RNase H-like HicB family nuclease